MKKRLALLFLFGCLAVRGSAQQKLDYLDAWVGRYPTYNNLKPKQHFLELPEIKRGLQKLLPQPDYLFLTKTCGKEVPIEKIGNYLIVRRCHKYACAYGSVVVVINLIDREMHIAIRNEKDTEQRWYSTNGKYAELPFEIKNAWIVTKKHE